MQFKTCMPAEVLVILDLTIKPFLACTLGYLSDSSLCRDSTVPAGTIRSIFFFKPIIMLSGKHRYNVEHRLLSYICSESLVLETKKKFKSIHLTT